MIRITEDRVELYTVPEIADQTLLLIVVGKHLEYIAAAESFLVVFGDKLIYRAEQLRVGMPGQSSMYVGGLPSHVTAERFSQHARRRALRYLHAELPRAPSAMSLREQSAPATEFLEELSLEPDFYGARGRIMVETYFNEAVSKVLRPLSDPSRWVTQDIPSRS
jgi:hypothetical protein